MKKILWESVINHNLVEFYIDISLFKKIIYYIDRCETQLSKKIDEELTKCLKENNLVK